MEGLNISVGGAEYDMIGCEIFNEVSWCDAGEGMIDSVCAVIISSFFLVATYDSNRFFDRETFRTL